jgi:hypothetical protein
MKKPFKNRGLSAINEAGPKALARHSTPETYNTCRGGESMPFEHDYRDSVPENNTRKEIDAPLVRILAEKAGGAQ